MTRSKAGAFVIAGLWAVRLEGCLRQPYQNLVVLEWNPSRSKRLNQAAWASARVKPSRNARVQSMQSTGPVDWKE
jgi:hypothetical protein